MSAFELSDDLTLGHPEMDDDHRQLVDILNTYAHVAAADPGSEAVVTCLVTLADRVRKHFAVEEALMRKVSFPSREAHARVHECLFLQLKVLTDVIADGTMEADRNTLDFLASWLIDHICGLDRELAEFAAGWTHTQQLQRAVNC